MAGAASEVAAIELKLLAPEDWPLVERLFGSKGATGGCWCMWWRRRGGKTWAGCKGEPNRLAFRALVESGAAHGVIALVKGEPIGWCNFGPRADFLRLGTSRVLQRQSRRERWSITCFYVRAGWRRQHVAQRLLERATAEAFRCGAEEIEGYPKTYGSGDSPAAFVWTGLPRMFEAAGFVPVKAEASQRLIYVRQRLGVSSAI
jgi:GNAT superfamily N-acetyltransferase